MNNIQLNPKLSIAYRIYPKVSKTTPIYNDNKLRLSELCLASFCRAIQGFDFKFWALLDNCPPEYEAIFRKYIQPNRLEIINLDGEGNASTFGRQVDILLDQDFSEIVYFAEDDYFYLPSGFNELVSLIQSGKAQFATPYDHPDLYHLDFHSYKSEIIVFGQRHWRTVASTCMTFMTSKKYLKSSEKIIRTYQKNNYDHSLWRVITKINNLNIFQFIKYILKGNQLYKSFLKMVYHTPYSFVFGKKYKLMSPIPTIATHMDSEGLAPGVDWQENFIEFDL